MTKPQIGLWLDDGPAKITTQTFWDELSMLGINTVAIMMGTGTSAVVSLKNLEWIKKTAKAHNISVVLTVWPEPKATYMASLEEHVGLLLKTSGAVALEFDTEGNWLAKNVRGFKNLADADLEFERVFARISIESGVRIELTTYPYHQENGRRAQLAKYVDRIFPQAYSVSHRDGGTVPFDSNFGPGGMQKLALELAKQIPVVPGRKPRTLCCGLAAYDQNWPGKTSAEAMKAAYDAALSYGPAEIRFWSSKWVLGAKRNGYAAAFLKSISQT